MKIEVRLSPDRQSPLSLSPYGGARSNAKEPISGLTVRIVSPWNY